LGLTRSLASCFEDGRNQRFVEHSLSELLAQRVLGLAAGYEDLNDHDTLRRDPLMALAAGKEDPLGLDRHHERATAGTIRLRLLKIGALLTVSVRRVYVRLASGFALRDVFEKAIRAVRSLLMEPAPS